VFITISNYYYVLGQRLSRASVRLFFLPR
jgi:hypothetical protein